MIHGWNAGVVKGTMHECLACLDQTTAVKLGPFFLVQVLFPSRKDVDRKGNLLRFFPGLSVVLQDTRWWNGSVGHWRCGSTQHGPQVACSQSPKALCCYELWVERIFSARPGRPNAFISRINHGSASSFMGCTRRCCQDRLQQRFCQQVTA